jgi:hypothetical protein
MPQFVEMDDKVTLFEQLEEMGQYPSSSLSSPHLFRKVEVAGLCVA